MANHPEEQEKIHREIDAFIGNKEPQLKDRHEMHYTSAVRYMKIFLKMYLFNL